MGVVLKKETGNNHRATPGDVRRYSLFTGKYSSTRVPAQTRGLGRETVLASRNHHQQHVPSVIAHRGGGAGNGVEAAAQTGDAVHASNFQTGTAVAALATTGDAIYASTAGTGGLGIFALNTVGNGADIRGGNIGITGRAPAGSGFPLVATDLNGNNLFWVDGSGNVFYRGGLKSFARTANGATATEFVPSTTAPTVEDNGSAQLVNGQAVVKLDPTFAATIDMQRPYRVFLTPNGDTRGLYVAAKTAGGFIVRETQGGHASLSFDYRILADGAGHANERMALVTTARSWPSSPLGAHHPAKTTPPMTAASLRQATHFTPAKK